uniref:Methyltransferase-like protein n=1 Tax=Karlodinium veneficum TaxID=407301 RepID=A7YXX6_KARVE|nr:methyltransferase-like protein [Karlodinium veneficum]
MPLDTHVGESANIYFRRIFKVLAWASCVILTRARSYATHDLETAVFENFDFSYESCTTFLSYIDWNENVTDDQWSVKLHRAVNCVRYREDLARDANRPAALTGLHIPTMVTPTIAKHLPHLPPFYFVLPIWDTVVSNEVRTTGLYDSLEIDVLMKLSVPGDAFVDIGANVGSVTVPMAFHVGRNGTVYAFEPFRQVFQYLNANVAVNGLENVHTFHTALSDKHAESSVHVPAPLLTEGQNVGMYGVFKQNSLEPNEPLSKHKQEEVSVRTLDSFQLPRADVVKIDVEGHAPRVLAGGVQTLKQHRPFLWFEHSGSTPDVLTESDMAYSCMQFTEATEDTFLCSPHERLHELSSRMNKQTD